LIAAESLPSGHFYVITSITRGVRALRDQTAPPPTDADRLDVWAENWRRRAIEVARSQGPALPAPESTDDTDDAVST
jgi:hypothetical protein